MKYIVSGKNINVTEALKDRAVKKLGKLEKFFAPDTEAHITMSVEKARQIVEITIPYNGVVMRAEISNEDMYSAIDKAVDILEGQFRRYKTRLEKRLYEGAYLSGDDTPEAPEDDVKEEMEFHVVRSKRFAIKPMDEEEAILQMNLLGHTFFVFSNAETKEVNVVYRRKDGNYGLIEPEF